MDFRIEPIKRRIRAAYPDVEISIVDNTRDDVGGVLYVRGAPEEMIDQMGISMDYIMVPLDDRKSSDLIIVPISTENAPGRFGI